MTKVKYLSRQIAEEYLRNYCKLININYCDDFLTKESYGVDTSESFPGLNAMEGIKCRLESNQRVDKYSLKYSLWVVVKYICSIQLYEIVENHCSFCFSFNKSLYCISYLHQAGKVSDKHYDMLLPIFDEEYQHRVLEILCKHNIDKLPLEDRLVGLKDTDKVFGCYSPLFIKNSRSIIKSSILNIDRNFINNELLANMFLDTLDNILDRFYCNQTPSSLKCKVKEAYEHDLVYCLKSSRRVNIVKDRLLASRYLLNMDETINTVLDILRGDKGV